MYCNHCGAPLGQNQLACPSCGRSVADVQTAIAIRSRVAGHLHLLAIFWFVMAAFWIIPTAIMFFLSAAATTAIPRTAPPPARIFGPILFLGLGILFLAIAAARAVTGYGLLKVLPWGRVLALIMGFLMLLDLPFGTALAVYTLWVLLPAEAGAEYQRISASRDSDYQQTARAPA
ncbi:MAG TPA: zinc ribbon domain-containing protein [Terriglobales bacterium]|nr:zinc ribbon domain-containing protein [Terriglobales bacterium]